MLQYPKVFVPGIETKPFYSESDISAPALYAKCVRPAIELGYGSAFISVLEPGTRIAPHYGMTNAKLRCQIQLLGDPAFLTVGDEEVEVRCGKLVIFDDSIVHWVRYGNASDSRRVCIVWDIRHPGASKSLEREVRLQIEAGRSPFPPQTHPV